MISHPCPRCWGTGLEPPDTGWRCALCREHPGTWEFEPMTDHKDEEPAARPSLLPIEKVADALFMHDLARRIVREFGYPAALTAGVLLLRHVIQYVRAGLNPPARDAFDEEVEAFGAFVLALGERGKGLAEALKVADKTPPEVKP